MLELDRLLRVHPLRRRPALIWKPWPSTAGRADFLRWEILLSSRVLDTPERVLATLVHEYAHLLAFSRDPRNGRGHGEVWRAAMRELGAEPRVRHDYPVVRRVSRTRAIYRCAGCGTEIVRARRLARGRRWVHAACGGGLRLERVERL